MLALIASDVLKLRREAQAVRIAAADRRLMAVAFVVMAIQHGGNPARYGPAGGLGNFKEDIEVISLAALVIGTIIGATSGTQDIESGVFRDLAATGRSRVAAFVTRRGAWAVVLPILAVTGGLAAVGCIALAGSSAPRRRRDRRQHRRRPGRQALQRRDRSRRVRARRLARPRHRHNARVLPGGAEPAAGHGLPGRCAPDLVPDRVIGGSATSSRPRTCRSGWAPRSSS